MVTDLGKLDADRAVLLAGISHDLRTPLSRLRLELELAPLPEATRAAMVADIEQMDAIVRQFLDYARKAPQAPATDIDLTAAVAAAVQRARVDAEPAFRRATRSSLPVSGSAASQSNLTVRSTI